MRDLRVVPPASARAQLEELFSPAVVDLLEQLIDERAANVVAALEAAKAERVWLTLEEAGEMLGCSSDAVRMRIRRGHLESSLQGRRRYVSAASVERLSSAA